MQKSDKQEILEAIAGVEKGLRNEFRSELRSELNNTETKLREDFRADIKTEIGLLREHMDTKFAAVEEEFKGVYQRFDGVESTLKDNTESIGNLMVEMVLVNEKIDGRVAI